jgi:hypothetical protein
MWQTPRNITQPLAHFTEKQFHVYKLTRVCVQFKIKNDSHENTKATPLVAATLIHQSSVILSCSNGIGTKLSSTMLRDRSSGSQCGGTSCRIKSGRTESSVTSVQ